MTQPEINQRDAPAEGPPATPRWVKIAAMVVGLVVLAVVLKVAVGGGARFQPRPALLLAGVERGIDVDQVDAGGRQRTQDRQVVAEHDPVPHAPSPPAPSARPQPG